MMMMMMVMMLMMMVMMTTTTTMIIIIIIINHHQYINHNHQHNHHNHHNNKHDKKKNNSKNNVATLRALGCPGVGSPEVGVQCPSERTCHRGTSVCHFAFLFGRQISYLTRVTFPPPRANDSLRRCINTSYVVVNLV